jgi:hypothetical protein
MSWPLSAIARANSAASRSYWSTKRRSDENDRVIAAADEIGQLAAPVAQSLELDEHAVRIRVVISAAVGRSAWPVEGTGQLGVRAGR